MNNNGGVRVRRKSGGVRVNNSGGVRVNNSEGIRVNNSEGVGIPCVKCDEQPVSDGYN